MLQKGLLTSDGHYNAEIYHLLNNKAHQSLLKLNFTHIDSIPGWKTFDITPIVLDWKQGFPNHGLQIRLTKDGKLLPCEGMLTKNEEDTAEQPSLTVFTHDHSSELLMGKLRASDVAAQQMRRRRNSKNTNSTAIPIKNADCHLKEMVVKAESLRLGSLHVLLPKQFNAGKCEGYCQKLDTKSLQKNTITSHADILSIYYRNTVGIQKAPSRCCKASSFKTIPMVFYDHSAKENIMAANIPAQVTKCSC